MNRYSLSIMAFDWRVDGSNFEMKEVKMATVTAAPLA